MKQDHAGFTRVAGLTRSDRFIPALDSQFFKIDDRTTDELLEATIKMSRLINYYNTNNVIDGNWENFFNSDIDILAMLLSNSRLETISARFEDISIRLQETNEAGHSTIIWNEAFLLLYNIVRMLQKYRLKLLLPENRNEDTAGIIRIADSLDEEFGKFIAGYAEFQRTFTGITDISLDDLQITGNSTSQKLLPGSIFKMDDDAGQRILLARNWFHALFSGLRVKFSNLIAAADYYLIHLQKEESIYEPHLGLFVTFLKLYRYLQDEINQVTGRHLHHYFNEVLKMEHQPAIPDTMRVVFEVAADKKVTMLPAGEIIMAEDPGTRESIEFALQQDTILTRTQVKELKTGYISTQPQFSSEENPYIEVTEWKVYAGEHPAVQPQHFKEEKNIHRPWALLGEEQSGLPLTGKTMEPAMLGFMIASPLLYAQDGKRNFTIKLYLSAESSRQFRDYVKNMSAVIGEPDTVIVPTLLREAFGMRITIAEGWYQVVRYNVRTIEQPAETCIELTFAMENTDPAVSLYHPAAHGDEYPAETPLLHLVLNPYSFHHPYSFCKDFVLERIGIQVTVSGSRQAQMRNSLGALTGTDPFQFFGPLPAKGSYLDVRNTNLFNRYTKAFSVHIEWFDLPKEPGGFETYFESYGNGIRNDSYTVSLSPLAGGRPALTPVHKQRFLLFETERSDTSQLFLKDTTKIKGVDYSRLHFGNDMLMDREADYGWETGMEGSLRIELESPDDAFGHRIYPQILPGLVAQNAKKLGARFRIPNPPYIPIAKSVAVDYTLSNTELLKNRVDDDGDVALFHIHPYGYKKIYPGLEVSSIRLVPLFERESCLMIGLQDAEPGRELSLLFELQETIYHHTATELEPVVWSYLQDNLWKPFSPGDILYDDTRHFFRSGIVTLQLPRSMTAGNTILNPYLYWIKASSGHRTAGSRTIAIFAQAAAAVRNNNSSISDEINELPPDSVKGFKQKIPHVTSLWQHFATRKGEHKETDSAYNTRISERLRHKDRARTPLDFAQMILEAFPKLLIVKCLGQGETGHLMLPGVSMQVVVVPKKDLGKSGAEEPRVSLAMLVQIKEFVDSRLPPFAKAEVGNAVYEPVKIICSVVLNKSRLNSNDGYYINLLNRDIRDYIAPWLSGEEKCLTIGGRIYISDILNFIRSRPYISYISGFSVLHFYKKYNTGAGRFESYVKDSFKANMSYVEASRPDAVLMPAETHMLTVAGSSVYQPSSQSGIGKLVIGRELLLAGDVEATTELATEAAEPDDDDQFNFQF